MHCLKNLNLRNPSLPPVSLQKATEVMCALTPANSPLSSPSKHGDRFIPSRAGANWSVNFHRINVRLQTISSVFSFFELWLCRELTVINYCNTFLCSKENEKSHNQNRKTKDGTSDSSKGKFGVLSVIFIILYLINSILLSPEQNNV